MKLLFLHALPLDGRMWSTTAQAFPGQILAPNLFDLGPTIESWAAAALQQAGNDELVVVGCSVGGSCALEVARAAPDQVAGLVLVGAKAGVNPDPAMRDKAIQLLETRGTAAAWDAYWAPLFAASTPTPIVQRAKAWAMDHDVASLVNGVRAFHDRRDLSAFAASWTKPLLCIAGAQDTAPPPAKQRALGTGPNRTFRLVPNSGHYVNLEQPTVFNDLLSQFVLTQDL